MAKINLDKTDLSLLRELQKDSNQSIRAISKKNLIPVSTLHRRIKRLEDKGVIKYYSAIIDPKKVGMGVTAFMLAQVEYGKDVSKVVEKIKKIKGVQEVHYTTGKWDLIIKLKVPSLDDYYKFSAERLIQLEGISNTMGLISPKTFMEDSKVQF